jgi:hypothetical protein
VRALRAHSGDTAPFRQGVLASAEEEAGGLSGLFPPINKEDLLEQRFQLTYTQHGGSGTSLTLADVDEMDWAEMVWWYERLMEERERESAALRAASKPKPK